jgi:hypothetical protein
MPEVAPVMTQVLPFMPPARRSRPSSVRACKEQAKYRQAVVWRRLALPNKAKFPDWSRQTGLYGQTGRFSFPSKHLDCSFQQYMTEAVVFQSV